MDVHGAAHRRDDTGNRRAHDGAGGPESGQQQCGGHRGERARHHLGTAEFDPTAFVAPPNNTYGDVGRGVLYSPGQKNIDASITRRFALVGRSNLMVRLDAFNLTNTPYFGFPNAAIGSPTVGQITTTIGDNRILQLAIKLDF